METIVNQILQIIWLWVWLYINQAVENFKIKIHGGPESWIWISNLSFFVEREREYQRKHLDIWRSPISECFSSIHILVV